MRQVTTLVLMSGLLLLGLAGCGGGAGDGAGGDPGSQAGPLRPLLDWEPTAEERARLLDLSGSSRTRMMSELAMIVAKQGKPVNAESVYVGLDRALEIRCTETCAISLK